jgi:hypothetical protein
MRTIIELMRWTGLRIGDALMCARSRIHGNRFSLTTQKGKTPLTVIIPDHVITALNALPLREDVHPNYFFWNGNSKHKSLTGRWQRKLERLNDYLSLRRDDGTPLDQYPGEHFLMGTAKKRQQTACPACRSPSLYGYLPCFKIASRRPGEQLDSHCAG